MKKRDDQKPRGPIPVKSGSRSYSLDDDSPDEALPDFDDFATSKPQTEDEEKEKEKETALSSPVLSEDEDEE